MHAPYLPGVALTSIKSATNKNLRPSFGIFICLEPPAVRSEGSKTLVLRLRDGFARNTIQKENFGPTRPERAGLIFAPAVGFEPTTNRLTADRSTTELRWIFPCD
jgi:hypothetical protein